MPLQLAEAKSIARSQLRGKNAKPADVNRLAQKLISQSYDTQRGGTFDYKTGSGQGMRRHERSGGDSVEYQTSDLSNYIDKILQRGGLQDAPQDRTQFPPAPNGTPSEAPIPTSRPDTGDNGGGGGGSEGDEEETEIIVDAVNDGFTWEQIAAGAAGIAALYALYRMGRKYKPEEIKAKVGALAVITPKDDTPRTGAENEPIKRETTDPRQIEAEERRLLSPPSQRLPAPEDASIRPATPEEIDAASKRPAVSPEEATTPRIATEPAPLRIEDQSDSDAAARSSVEQGSDRPSNQPRFDKRSSIEQVIDEQVGNADDVMTRNDIAASQGKGGRVPPPEGQFPPGLMDRLAKMKYADVPTYLRQVNPNIGDELVNRILQSLATRAARP